jgi:adenylate cyclase
MATTRRLAAILAADVAGCPRLMRADDGTHERLKAHLRELLDPKINEHHCRTVQKIPARPAGGISECVEAARWAVEMRRAIHEQNTVEATLGARRPRM